MPTGINATVVYLRHSVNGVVVPCIFANRIANVRNHEPYEVEGLLVHVSHVRYHEFQSLKVHEGRGASGNIFGTLFKFQCRISSIHRMHIFAINRDSYLNQAILIRLQHSRIPTRSQPPGFYSPVDAIAMQANTPEYRIF